MKVTYFRRRTSYPVKVGSVTIGGTAPISVQSMCNVKTSHVQAVIKQITSLEKAGCEIIRVSVLDDKDAVAIRRIKNKINIPLCADIHFDYTLGLHAIESGADIIRFNPGNISRREHIRELTAAAKQNGIPIRIGVNAGSLKRVAYKGETAGQALAAEALKTIRLLERLHFRSLIVSAKAHSVVDTIEANRIMAAKTEYPLHIGITAAGRGEYAIIKSSLGIGCLLQAGIGDTIRVSLTDDPVHEVRVGYEVLEALGLRKRSWEVIACPTCGRTQFDVIGVAQKLEALLQQKKVTVPKSNYKIAVMGCVVNGPGESKDADIGITGGRGVGFVFKNGKLLKKVPEKKLLSVLLNEICQK